MAAKVFEVLDKFNCVDSNNVFVGYDLSQQCCERADWYFVDRLENIDKANDYNPDLSDYVFDKSYINEDLEKPEDRYNETSIVAFRLVNSNNEELFLILENTHNGYYNHGFEFGDSNGNIRSGSL